MSSFSVSECKDDEYKCPGSPHCIPVEYLCDGLPDCLFGEDELNCTGTVLLFEQIISKFNNDKD